MSKLTLKELEDLSRTMYFETIFSEVSPQQAFAKLMWEPNRLNFTQIEIEDISGYISLIDKRCRKEYITYCAEFTQHDYAIGQRYIFFTDEQDLVWFKLRFL